MTAATAKERPAAIAELLGPWRLAGIITPIDSDQAFDVGIAVLEAGNFELAVQHLRWAVACEPGNPKRARALAMALSSSGLALEAIRVLAAHDRNEAPRLVGRMLVEAKRAGDAVPVLRYAARRFRAADDFALLAITANLADNDAVSVEAARRAIVLGSTAVDVQVVLATGLYRLGEFVECEQIAQQLITTRASKDVRAIGLHAMARALAGQGRHVDAHPYAKEAGRLNPTGALARELQETLDCIVAQTAPPVRESGEASMERQAFLDLEAGNLEQLTSAITSPSWAIARAALAACEFRTDDENGIPVAPRALDAALDIIARTNGAQSVDAVLARIRAMKIRDNAYIQIDPPPPLGSRFTVEEFEKLHAERERRPHRPSALLSYAR